MTTTVFCVDFDETLLATDRLRADLVEEIRHLGGDTLVAAYNHAYEQTRSEHGVPHLPLVLKNLVDQASITTEMHQSLAGLFHNFPYQSYVYEGAEETILHLKKYGKVLLFSDGNAYFQPQKIHATSIKNLVDSVIVLSNKISSFDELSGYWPAERYVFIDDKQKVLDAAKDYFGNRATTILVRQGRYVESSTISTADQSVASIADVAQLPF